MHYVYVLVNEDQQIYIGYTKDLRRRMTEHGYGKGYTRKGRDWRLSYYEAFVSKKDAVRRERALKQSPQSRRWLRDRIEDSLELCRKS